MIGFRHEFSRPFAVTAIYSLVLGLGIALLRGVARPDCLPCLIATLVTGAAVLAAWTAIWTRRMKVYVSPAGLRCYTAWCLYRFVGWPDMTRVRPVSFLGLRYLRVWSTSQRSPVWVPLFLSDLPEFRKAVQGYAGSGNVVSQYLVGIRA